MSCHQELGQALQLGDAGRNQRQKFKLSAGQAFLVPPSNLSELGRSLAIHDRIQDGANTAGETNKKTHFPGDTRSRPKMEDVEVERSHAVPNTPHL